MYESEDLSASEYKLTAMVKKYSPGGGEILIVDNLGLVIGEQPVIGNRCQDTGRNIAIPRSGYGIVEATTHTETFPRRGYGIMRIDFIAQI